MMGKPITGRSFGGCVRYIVNKQEAKLLSAEGVRMENAETLIQDFNLQRKMRPELGKAVGHLVLSWSKEDVSKLDDQIMVERAEEYMQRMNIRNTQYVIVRHSDREHPHLHLIYNRVDNNGKTITDKNSFAKNIQACKDITLKYGYHLGKGKDQVNRNALRGKEKIRYELYDAIKAATRKATNWKVVETELQKQGIHIHYKYRSGTNEVQGISFEKNGLKFKGSAIDRSFSFARLDAQLYQNNQVQEYHQTRASNQHEWAHQIKKELKQDLQTKQPNHPDGNKSLLETLLQPEYVPMADSTVSEEEKRRRKRRKKEQRQGMSR